MKHQIKYVLVILLSLFWLNAMAAAPVTEVHVTLSDYKVELDKTSIPAGPVKFVINNAGKQQHELVLEMAGDNDKALMANGKTAEVERIKPGESAQLEWVIDKPGNYQLACHIRYKSSDHYMMGMVGKLTVTQK